MKTVEHLSKEQLAAYAADQSTPGETEAIEKHLLLCSNCRNSMPAPTTEQFWSELLLNEPELEENFENEIIYPKSSPFSAVLAFFRQPATLGACALILIVGLAFMIWFGASKQPNPQQEVVQINETPKIEINPPTNENLPVLANDKIQTAGDRKSSQSQMSSRAKPKINLPDKTKDSNKFKEKEVTELALLLENTPLAVSSLRPNGDMILRGTTGKENSSPASVFSLLAPVGETVIDTMPEFRWKKVLNAKSYQISIFDADFNEVLTAKVSGNNFKLDKPLSRGAKYLWRVEANTETGKIVAPLPPQPPAVFRIAAASAESKIESLKRNESNPMKLALFYASEGMLDSAVCTLKEILAKNPKHTAARRLLAQVEQWKKENNATVQRCGPSTETKADQ